MKKYKGTLHLFDRTEHIGKIVFDDGGESAMSKFPDTFEEGDRVEVVFRNDDPSQKIVNVVVPGEKEYYGFVQVYNEKKRLGSILPTYPEMRELLFFFERDFQKDLEPKFKISVKFKIRKENDG